MVSAVGMGATVAGIFHLGTHAFFKALLFLGAGSVIHAMEHGHHKSQISKHGEETSGQVDTEKEFDPNDMRLMGGLSNRMP